MFGKVCKSDLLLLMKTSIQEKPSRLRAKYSPRANALLILMLFFCGLSISPKVGEAQTARADQWPAAWVNPLTGSRGGSVEITTNHGAWSNGCPNWDSSRAYTWYLDRNADPPPSDPRQQHLGIDLRIAETRPVYAIADGTIVASSTNLAGWGTFSQGVIIVRHDSLQGPFTAAYAHLKRAVNSRTTAIWQAGDQIRSGEILGAIVRVGTGPHLHFGIQPGVHQNIRAFSSTPGTGNCLDQDLGTVDPIPYLRTRAPNRCRNLFDRNSAVPVNYGAPFNPFASDRALLFEAVCRGDGNVELVSGHNYADQLTFQDGYYWDGGKWIRFRFSGANRDGIWFRGLAIASVPARLFPSVGSDKANFFVVWTCLRVSGEWRCGFRDARRSDPSWQVQAFIYE